MGRVSHMCSRITGATDAAIVVPWPKRAKQAIRPRTLQLTADKSGIVGYTATGETG